MKTTDELVPGTTAAVLITMLAIGSAPSRADELADPPLVIISQGQPTSYSRSVLVKNLALETIDIDDDAAYPVSDLRYQAVKMAAVLSPFKIQPGAEIQITAEDDYVPWIPYSQLSNMAANQSIAYLAIEDPQRKWPPLRPETAGPYYLVWVNPELSKIGANAWPWRIKTIAVTTGADEAAALPAETLATGSPARLGYDVYKKNCRSCHSVNNAGPSRMGRDLNRPMNPTEYFRDGILRKFIRDPQSIRKIPNSRMGPFPDSRISDTELDQLIAYLQHIAMQESAHARIE